METLPLESLSMIHAEETATFDENVDSITTEQPVLSANHDENDSHGGGSKPLCAAQLKGDVAFSDTGSDVSSDSSMSDDVTDSFVSHCCVSFDRHSGSGSDAAALDDGRSPSSPDHHHHKQQQDSVEGRSIRTVVAKRLTSIRSVVGAGRHRTPAKEYSIVCLLDLEHADHTHRKATINITKLSPPPPPPTAAIVPTSHDKKRKPHSIHRSTTMKLTGKPFGALQLPLLHLFAGGSRGEEVLFQRNLLDIVDFRRVTVGPTNATAASAMHIDDRKPFMFSHLPVAFQNWHVGELREHPDRPLPPFHPPYACCGDIGLDIMFHPLEKQALQHVKGGTPRYQHYDTLRLRFPTSRDRERWYTALQLVQGELLQDALRAAADEAAGASATVDTARTAPSFSEMQRQVYRFLGDGCRGGADNGSEDTDKGADAVPLPAPPCGGVAELQFLERRKPRRFRAVYDEGSANGISIEVGPCTLGQRWRGVPTHRLEAPTLVVHVPKSGWGTQLFLERLDASTMKRQCLEFFAKSFDDRTKWVAWLVALGAKQEQALLQERAREQQKKEAAEAEEGRLAFEQFVRPPAVERVRDVSSQQLMERELSAPSPLLDAAAEVSSPCGNSPAMPFFTEEEDRVMFEAASRRNGRPPATRAAMTPIAEMAATGVIVAGSWMLVQHACLGAAPEMHFVLISRKHEASTTSPRGREADAGSLICAAAPDRADVVIDVDVLQSVAFHGDLTVSFRLKSQDGALSVATSDDASAAAVDASPRVAASSAQLDDVLCCVRLLGEPLSTRLMDYASLISFEKALRSTHVDVFRH